MQKIIPHFWYNKEAKEAAAFYTSLFQHSAIKSSIKITDTPSGDCDIVSFTLSNQEFMAISAGPYFKLNPSISLFVVFDTEAEIESVWNKLIDGGKALMPYQTYPWAKKYGWVEDKYGLSWQLSLTESHTAEQKITPSLMFTQDKAGKAKEAIEFYLQIFSNGGLEMMSAYEKGEGDTEGFIKYARFTLLGQQFIAMDSSHSHNFVFNEAVSFIVECDTQKEIDYYWEKLSAVPESEQCGWVKDKYGVSWQIVPSMLGEMMASNDPEKTHRVNQAVLKMKKLDIAAIEAAAARV